MKRSRRQRQSFHRVNPAMQLIRRLRGMGQDGVDPESGLPFETTVTPATTDGQQIGQLDAQIATSPAWGSGSQPFNWTGFVNALTKGAAAGTQIYNATQTPALIPGTQAVYNKATGQYYNPTTGQVVNPNFATAATALTSSPLLLIGGLLLGGLVLVAAMGGRR